MEPLFGLMMSTLVASVAYLVAWSLARDRAAAWQEAAREVGLEDVRLSTSFGMLSRLTGRSGRLAVTIERFSRGKNSRGTRVVVGGLGHQSQLLVRQEGFGSLFEKALGERETEVGDRAFDAKAFLQGNPALIRAVLDAKTRALLQPLMNGRMYPPRSEGEGGLPVRVWIESDALNVEIHEPAFGGGARRMPQVLRLLLEIGRGLVRPADLAERIAANTGDEPVDAVRQGNLRTLATEYPAHPATRQALAAALADASPAVRLEAALSLGPEGRETLMDLATRVDADDEVSARALVALDAAAPTAAVISTLRDARALGRRAVARASVATLSRRAADDVVEALGEVLAADEADLSAAAGAALGLPHFAGNQRAEASLIRALERDEAEVRLAAARSLGVVGTPAAVLPLSGCAGSHRFDRALRAAARQSVAEIQSRVTGGSPGQLSLAADAVGQVSLAPEDVTGRVSLPGDEPKASH